MSTDPTIIPSEARAELQQMALDAQGQLLDTFDAIEAGDLVATVVALTTATEKVRTLNENIRPLALRVIFDIEQSFGIKFGEASR